LFHVSSRFGVPRSAQKPLALNAGRDAFRLFSQALRLIGQALIQWRGLFDTASLLHGATPHTRRRERCCDLLTDSCHGTER
jgi:hypothetical protein